MVLLQRPCRVMLGILLLALSLLMLPLSMATAQQQGSPLHGLWKITSGPAQSASGSCGAERTTWVAQIAAWAPGGWFSIRHAYPSATVTNAEVLAVLPAQHKPEDWPESARPSQAVADAVNKLGLEYRFSGTLSADLNELTGNETQICFYWDGDELTGYQRVAVPIRANRMAYAFGPIDAAGGPWLTSIKQGQSVVFVFDVDEMLGWDAVWVQVVGSNPTIWLKLLPDEANTRYVSGPVTIAEPPTVNLNLPAEALEGRLYAKVGETPQFMVYPSLVLIQETIEAP